jgi:hypothetical protein
MASFDEDIEWLMEAKAVPRRIAADAYRDAEKALKARRPKGLAAIEAAAKGEIPSVRDEALRLLDEPARQPAAVEALARVKKESKHPVAACRAALAQASYDADKALELLRARPAPAKASKASAKPATPALDVNHSLHALSGRTAADAVLLAKRMRVLTKEEKRLHRDDRVYDYDCCVVFQSDGAWRRRERPRPFADLWAGDDGRLTLLLGNVIHTLEHAGAADSAKFVVEGARPLCLAGCDGVGEVAFDPFAREKKVIWWRENGKDWVELPYPGGILSPLHVQVMRDRIWLSGWRQTVASYDGQRWKEAAVEHGEADRGSGNFNRFAVSPEGRVLASLQGTLYEGDADQIRRVHYAGHDEVSSIAWFGGSFWVAHARLGICRWNGEKIVPVTAIAKLHGFDTTAEARLSARGSLLAMSRAELLESTDGVTFRTITSSREIAAVVGSEDVYWATADPSKLPRAK